MKLSDMIILVLVFSVAQLFINYMNPTPQEQCVSAGLAATESNNITITETVEAKIWLRCLGSN